MQKKFLYVLLLSLLACKRETSPANQTTETKKCRLVKMIQGTHNGAGTDTTFARS